MQIKDTQQVSHFEDKAISIFDMNRAVNPFGTNRVVSSLFQRVERIALATQLLLKPLPETNEHRVRIEKTVHDIVVQAASFTGGVAHTQSAPLVALTAKVRTLLAFLDLAHIAGSLSLHNLEIIKGAYIDMLRFVSEGVQQGAAEEVSLTTEDMLSHTAKRQQKTYKDTIKDSKKDIAQKEENVPENASAPTIAKVREVPLAVKRAVKSRRVTIIDALTKRGQATISDIAQELPSVSTKTVQRELQQLIADGVVERQGERRWAVYTLTV